MPGSAAFGASFPLRSNQTTPLISPDCAVGVGVGVALSVVVSVGVMVIVAVQVAVKRFFAKIAEQPDVVLSHIGRAVAPLERTLARITSVTLAIEAFSNPSYLLWSAAPPSVVSRQTLSQ
jgi:hypothetical protein